jgi:hypothetical protein
LNAIELALAHKKPACQLAIGNRNCFLQYDFAVPLREGL